jgi:hypothetical protein
VLVVVLHVYAQSVMYPPSNTHVPSVLLPEMKHRVVLSLLNNIKVYVVTHAKVKYRPIVALSDDVVSV